MSCQFMTSGKCTFGNAHKIVGIPQRYNKPNTMFLPGGQITAARLQAAWPFWPFLFYDEAFPGFFCSVRCWHRRVFSGWFWGKTKRFQTGASGRLQESTGDGRPWEIASQPTGIFGVAFNFFCKLRDTCRIERKKPQNPTSTFSATSPAATDAYPTNGHQKEKQDTNNNAHRVTCRERKHVGQLIYPAF